MLVEAAVPTSFIDQDAAFTAEESEGARSPFSVFGDGCIASAAWENEAFLEQLIACTVPPARYRLKLSDDAWERHREDMAQVALEAFYEFNQQPFNYILGVIRHRLADYALINIYGRQAGHNSQYSRDYYVHNVPEPEMDMDTFLAAFASSQTLSRPVEAAIIAQESQPHQDRFWHRVEREMIAILVATGGRKIRSDKIRRYSQVLVKRLQGKTNHVVALELGLSLEEALGILERARERMREFLALSSLMQGLVWAWGHLMVYWPEEITADLLNSGRKFVAILPHGEFNVSYHDQRCFVQAGVQVRGKVRTRQVTIGQLGSLTYSQLYHGTLELKQKMVKLGAMPKDGMLPV